MWFRRPTSLFPNTLSWTFSNRNTNWKALYSEYPYTHRLDPAINILLRLLYIYPYSHHFILFFDTFQVASIGTLLPQTFLTGVFEPYFFLFFGNISWMFFSHVIFSIEFWFLLYFSLFLLLIFFLQKDVMFRSRCRW